MGSDSHHSRPLLHRPQQALSSNRIFVLVILGALVMLVAWTTHNTKKGEDPWVLASDDRYVNKKGSERKRSGSLSRISVRDDPSSARLKQRSSRSSSHAGSSDNNDDETNFAPVTDGLDDSNEPDEGASMDNDDNADDVTADDDSQDEEQQSGDESSGDGVVGLQGPPVTAADSSTVNAADNREAPYGDFCETRPRGEKELWNMRKKVISFSLFLPDDQKGQELPRYLLGGVEANVRLAKLFYPEWIVRIYVLNLSDEQIAEILNLDDKTLEVVKCHDESPLNKGNSARKMYMRFLVVDDPTVEYGIIRDLDSRPSIRELLAVNEWISSGLGFHTLRDHAWHSIPIMGCSWGAKRGTIDITAKVRQAVQDHPNGEVPGCCADDQNFLSSYVWPYVKDNAIDHDMQPGRCQGYGAKVCRKYPLTNRDDANMYVGQPFKNDGEYLGTRDTHYECSVDCKHSNEEWYTDMGTTSNF